METKENALYESDRIVGLAMNIAEMMLEKGAQIQRVENTIVRICLAYGAKKVEPFAITSLIQASVLMPDGYHTTQIKRVYETSTDLGMLQALARLVYKISSEIPSLDEAERLFEETVSARRKPGWLEMLGYGLGAGAFSLTFQGDYFDFLVAFLIGCGIFWFNVWLTNKVINSLARIFIDSLLSGTVAMLFCAIGVGHDLVAINSGTIMLFITGILFGNALKDLLCGDLVAGMLKSLQALLSAVMIAAGYSISLWIGGFLPSLDPIAPMEIPFWVWYLATGVIGPFGFCLVYRLPFRYMAYSIGGALLGYTVWYLLSTFTSLDPKLMCNLVATVVLAAYCESLGAIIKTPTTLFTLPGLVPLAPGFHLYNATFYLMQGDTANFTTSALNTALILFGIAVGLVGVSLIVRLVKVPKFQRHLRKSHKVR